MPALSVIANYQAVSKQLIVEVQAKRGAHPVELLDVQVAVGPVVLAAGQTDVNGKYTKAIPFDQPAKVYDVEASTITGQLSIATTTFKVPQPYEVTEQTPMLELTVTYVKVEGNFNLLVTLTARRGTTPIQNQLVLMSCVDIGHPLLHDHGWTSPQGIAYGQFTVPADGRTTVPVMVTALLRNIEGATSCALPFTLTCERHTPVTMPYRASEIDEVNGIWEITANPEDGQHNPCKDVRLTMSVENGTLISPAVMDTNEHGEARFRVQTSQVEEQSKFTIDCPSIRNNGIVRLWRYINLKRMPAPRLFRTCDILAGTSAIIVLVCALLLVTGVWRRATSNSNQSAVTDVVQTTREDGLTDVERNVYQYSKYDTLKYSESSKARAATATRDSLAAVPKERSGIPFGIGIGTLFMTIFVSALLFVCCVVTIVFIKLKRLKELSMRYFWEIHEGVADNDPGFLQRLEDRTLKSPVVQPATPAGTPAAGTADASAARKEGGFMSHLPAVAMFGVVDLIVDKILGMGKNKK